MKNNLKSTILIGKGLEPEKAVALEVVKAKEDGKLKGLAVDVVASTKGSIGAGVSYDIYKNDLVEIDTGIYYTKNVRDLFSKQTAKGMPDIKIGLSAKMRFGNGRLLKRFLK